jgi:hypothetical protein
MMKTTIRLDPNATRNAIEQSIRNNAQVIIDTPASPQSTINGFLISGDEKTLLMEITGKPLVDPVNLVNSSADVQLYAEQRYHFNVQIAACPKWGDTQALALDRPQTIQVIDRRRFWRAKLAPSSRVTLEWTHCGAIQKHVAIMLNISADGMACRIDDIGAAAVEINESLTARFSIPGESTPFELEAVLHNKLPSSPGATILGLQFTRVYNAVAQLAHLRDMLNEPQPFKKDNKVLV